MAWELDYTDKEALLIKLRVATIIWSGHCDLHKASTDVGSCLIPGIQWAEVRSSSGVCRDLLVSDDLHTPPCAVGSHAHHKMETN